MMGKARVEVFKVSSSGKWGGLRQEGYIFNVYFCIKSVLPPGQRNIFGLLEVRVCLKSRSIFQFQQCHRLRQNIYVTVISIHAHRQQKNPTSFRAKSRGSHVVCILQ